MRDESAGITRDCGFFLFLPQLRHTVAASLARSSFATSRTDAASCTTNMERKGTLDVVAALLPQFP
jgi:hypothetical protein